ncbi:centrosome and spindle pole-associated protein 1 isoform X4 [Sphaerodactylus townsendi]|uniref:centrosome and spindle pole-associated protein 1 isoform X4 n=1 Tax=Sphaerodactylus townsendi TaxID=933632 RepID=UPI002026EB65|nr:centrosome and spindle pole-associated protein 1 isoform X4 [Sphaerodactylus townsendi]
MGSHREELLPPWATNLKKMTDNLDQFIEDQKAKLAQDKAKLENDPPYMEMRSRSAEKLTETNRMLISMAKENIPPNNQETDVLEYGLSLPLGEEYERKKHKLKEELRQDYRRYLSQDISQAKKKKKYLTSGEVDPYTQGLSLPIGDRLSAKDRLRLERNKEYNQYLREQEEWNEKLRRVGKKYTDCQTEPHKKGIAFSRSQPELHTQILSPRRDEDTFRKDACTSTEACDRLSNRQSLDEHHKPDNECDRGDSILRKKTDEEPNISNRKHQRVDSKPGISVRGYQKFDGDHDSEVDEEMDPRFRYESDYDRKPLRVFHAQRNQASSANERAQPTSREVPFATGLIIGGQDREHLQRRKEQYRQELMEQMAAQQRNKQREKQLQLPVAATGALDPEKKLSEEKPDRLREMGFAPQISEERSPPERPRAAFQTPTPGPVSISAPPALPVNEDFHRGLSSALGEMLAPRIAPLPPPPPPPPTLTANYRTPYDDAYYFYGARNPLDPSLAYYGMGMMGIQPSSAPAPVVDASQKPFAGSVSRSGPKLTNEKQTGLGIFPEEKPKTSREATLAYQQELQKQIKEREERRRKEKEEKEQYEAKLEAEMRNYNPWGKEGGGAPLRDKKGNLITDLNVMHKQNEDAYHNPEARVYEDKRAVVSVDLSLASPRLENTDESTNKIAGCNYTQTSPYARGNVFGEQPTPEQLRRQESYKNFLRFQIEEKRKREEAERERRRLEEEREEKILAEQRARIQREYEEEQEKKRRREEEQRLKNEELCRLAEERKKEAEKKKQEEEERLDKQLKQFGEREKHIRMEGEKSLDRQFSPLIPNKGLVKEEKAFLVESRMSYYTQDDPQSRVPSPPVPARRNQLRAYEKKNVINELSEMRKQLRSEERRLQEQLLKVHGDDDDLPVKGRKHSMDIFEMARLRMQAPVRRPSSKDVIDPINLQNIRDFNELKYKDSESRVETRYMYPDPPTNDNALDIQQQALLREQQKKLKKMRKNAEVLDFDDPVPGCKLRDRGMIRDDSNEFLKNSLLESESAFIATDGDAFPTLDVPHFSVTFTPPPPLSARERRREKKKDPLQLSSRAEQVEDDVPLRLTPPLHPDNISLHSGSSLNIDQLKARNEERLQRLCELQKKAIHIGEDVSLGNADDILKQLPSNDGRRPNSVDTVATEPWLRPGTSETLKRFMAGQSDQAKLSSENNPFSWQGLSTAHG